MSKIGTSARNAAASAIGALLNGGTIQIRSGAPPTNPADADDGTLLCTLNFANPAFGAPSDGTVNASTIAAAEIAETGQAGHFRYKSSGGTVIMQGTAGEDTDTPDLELTDKDLVSGNFLSVTSIAITAPEECS
jgi:formylmethanofuran dehydrogenase subunit C